LSGRLGKPPAERGLRVEPILQPRHGEQIVELVGAQRSTPEVALRIGEDDQAVEDLLERAERR
jgi:hypothetical protein